MQIFERKSTTKWHISILYKIQYFKERTRVCAIVLYQTT